MKRYLNFSIFILWVACPIDFSEVRVRHSNFYLDEQVALIANSKNLNASKELAYI